MGIWLCGGGAKGGSGVGGAGAYCAQIFGTIPEGSYAVSVGAAQGVSSVGSLLSVAAVSGKNGGTGGGGTGTGDKLPKIPFGDAVNFKKHCAGGGGGLRVNHTEMGSPTSSTIGYGGSNGSDGGGGGSGMGGGDYGGGRGGSAYAGPSVDVSADSGYGATFYGSGGGGGGYAYDLWNGKANGAGGSGYQGVVYIIVPV